MKKLLALALLCFSASAQTPTHSVVLTWTWTQSGGDPATGFNVLRSSVSGDCTAVPMKGTCAVIDTTASAAVLTYTDSNVSAGQTWYYAVVPFNTGGSAVPSNEASCTVPFSAPVGSTALSVKVK